LPVHFNQLDFIYHGPLRDEFLSRALLLLKSDYDHFSLSLNSTPNVDYYFYNDFSNLYKDNPVPKYWVTQNRALDFLSILDGETTRRLERSDKFEHGAFATWEEAYYVTSTLHCVKVCTHSAEEVPNKDVIFNGEGCLLNGFSRRLNDDEVKLDRGTDRAQFLMQRDNKTFTCTCDVFTFNGIYCPEILATLQLTQHINNYQCLNGTLSSRKMGRPNSTFGNCYCINLLLN
jgi:hypothetical protein